MCSGRIRRHRAQEHKLTEGDRDGSLMGSDDEEPEEMTVPCKGKNSAVRKRGRREEISHGTHGYPLIGDMAKKEVTPGVLCLTSRME